jgi:hypothetical protein
VRALVADELSEIDKIVNAILLEKGQTKAQPVKRTGSDPNLFLFQ